MADPISLEDEALTNGELLNELDDALEVASKELNEAMDHLGAAHFYRQLLSERLDK